MKSAAPMASQHGSLPPADISSTLCAVSIGCRAFALEQKHWSFHACSEHKVVSGNDDNWRTRYIRGLLKGCESARRKPYIEAALKAVETPRCIVRNVCSNYLYAERILSTCNVSQFEPFSSGAAACAHDYRSTSILQAATCKFRNAVSVDDASAQFQVNIMSTYAWHAYGGQFDCGGYPFMIPVLKSMTRQQFENYYEKHSLPFILVNAAPEWKAHRLWTLDKLKDRCADVKFSISHRVGAFHDKRIRIRMTMGDYISYMRSQSDEMPLYIFDSKFAKKCPSLLQDYNAHTSFPWLCHDLFEPLGVSHRPDFRWLVIGPARTGAPFHVDPNHTSAWNMCVSGRKRWALYPPNCIPPGVEVEYDTAGAVVDFSAPFSPVRWYLQVYPMLSKEQKPIEFVQRAGDVVFIPAGWWHQVLNLEETVSVTENFISPTNIMQAMIELRRDNAKTHGSSEKREVQADSGSGAAVDAHGLRLSPVIHSAGLTPLEHWKKCAEAAGFQEFFREGERFQFELMSLKSEADKQLADCRTHYDSFHHQLAKMPSDSMGHYFSSLHHFAQSFSCVDLWRPRLLQAMRKWQPSISADALDIEAMSSRYNPVFRIRWRTAHAHEFSSAVIKLFSPYFPNAQPAWQPNTAVNAYHAEKTMLEDISRKEYDGINAPRLLFADILDCGDAWAWPFIISTELSGTSLRTFARDAAATDTSSSSHIFGLAETKQRVLFHSVCRLLSRLQTVCLKHPQAIIPINTIHPAFPATLYTSTRWVPYIRHLVELRDSVYARRVNSRSVSACLLATMDTILPTISDVWRLLPGTAVSIHGDTSTIVQPCRVHGDLTAENVFLGGGVIDFADSMFGDPLYDYVAVFCSMLQCDPSSLHKMHAAHHKQVKDPQTRELLGPSLDVWRFLNILILHPVDGFHMLQERMGMMDDWNSVLQWLQAPYLRVAVAASASFAC